MSCAEDLKFLYMNEKLHLGGNIERIPRSYAAMERIVTELFVAQGFDSGRTQSFIVDVLTYHGVESASTFHHLNDAAQYARLLRVLEDPEDEEEIANLFSIENLPEDIKNHYHLS